MSILKNKKLWLLAGLVLVIELLASCEQDGSEGAEDRQSDTINTGVNRIVESVEKVQKSSPLPVFDFSQEYQTLVDVLTIRAEGTNGTAVATNLDGSLKWWCPTLGAPIPSTYQVTPSQQYVDIDSDGTREKLPVDLPEPTGVIVGDSSATWILCLDNAGTKFAKYDEANIEWVSGEVSGLPADKRSRVDEITFEFTDLNEEDEG